MAFVLIQCAFLFNFRLCGLLANVLLVLPTDKVYICFSFSFLIFLLAMIKGDFATHQPLTHTQKDLRLALAMSEAYDHPLPITATTNEIYKHAKRVGYAEHDSSAVYIRSKF